MARSSPSRLGWPTSQLKGSACQLFQLWGYKSTFLWGSWGSNSGPHACIASPWLTEPSPWLLTAFLSPTFEICTGSVFAGVCSLDKFVESLIGGAGIQTQARFDAAHNSCALSFSRASSCFEWNDVGEISGVQATSSLSPFLTFHSAKPAPTYSVKIVKIGICLCTWGTSQGHGVPKHTLNTTQER